MNDEARKFWYWAFRDRLGIDCPPTVPGLDSEANCSGTSCGRCANNWVEHQVARKDENDERYILLGESDV